MREGGGPIAAVTNRESGTTSFSVLNYELLYSLYFTSSDSTAHDATEERHESEGARVLGKRCPVRPHVDGYCNRCHRSKHRPQALRRPAPCHIQPSRGGSTCVIHRPEHSASKANAPELLDGGHALKGSVQAELHGPQLRAGRIRQAPLPRCHRLPCMCHRITSARWCHEHRACNTVKHRNPRQLHQNLRVWDDPKVKVKHR